MLSNLRLTTCKCVHLITHGCFTSQDKDGTVGGHTIWSAIAKSPMLHANFMALCFIEPELLPIKVLHCGNRDFRSFLLLWPWPWSGDLHIQTRPVFPGNIPDVQNMNFVSREFQKLSSDRQTRLKLYATLLRVCDQLWLFSCNRQIFYWS